MSADVGYIYRVASTDADQLRTLINKHVGNGGWTFGGAAQWDFDSRRGRKNLRPIIKIPTEGALDLQGDFGHAFNSDAEVRWKRRDDGGYDVLILSEKEQTVEGGEPLRVRWWNSKDNRWEDKDWQIRRYTKAGIVRGDNQLVIRYIDYLAPNSAVQFQRLLKVEP
jgi:hypothetical protein